MTSSRATLLRTACFAVTALALVSGAFAQGYPNKPIKVINPWPPGGPADGLMRPVAEKLAQALGQPIVVENRSGANGMIGHAVVAQAAPDGYTLIMMHVGPMTISPAIQEKMAYDPVKDFTPITQLSSSPLVMVVRPDLPIRNVPEFLDYIKARPGKMNLGSVGQGSTTHLSAELMRTMTGISYVHVPYKGSGPVLTDMIGKQIDFSFLNYGGAAGFIKSGQVRAIAMTSLKRSALQPDLPAISETLPGYELNAWYGLGGPAGLPKDIVDRLQRELVTILKMPDIVEKLHALTYEPEGTTPEQFAQKIKADTALFAKVVQAAGIPKQ
jgi:tripartite-type tricarboxylate transporter receptor subunit TctC